MIDALKQNKSFLLIGATGFFAGIFVAIFSGYYMYILPFIVLSSLVAIFSQTLKRNLGIVTWTCLFLSIFLGGARAAEDILFQTVDLIRILRIALLTAVFFISIIIIFFNKFRGVKLSLKSPLVWFLVYAVIAMLSSTYSDQSFVSLWKGFEVFVYVIGAMFILRSMKSFKEIEKFWTLNLFFLVLLVGSAYLSAIFVPSEAFKEIRGVSFKLLEGVYPPINSNSLTQMAAMLIAIFIVRYVYDKARIRYLSLTLLTLPTLVLSYGRTSILALFVAMLVFLILNRKYYYLFLLGMISLLVFWVDGYSYVELFLQKGGTLNTMSGRLNNWPQAWELFKKSPIYGYGYYVAARIIFAERGGIEKFATTDNTYFDVLLSVGIIGFIPFILMLYSFQKKMFSTWTFSQNVSIMRLRYEILCVAIIVFFRSLTGPSIQILHWNLPIFLSLVVCTQSLEKVESSNSSQLS
jgi:O-antigen ligase